MDMSQFDVRPLNSAMQFPGLDEFPYRVVVSSWENHQLWYYTINFADNIPRPKFEYETKSEAVERGINAAKPYKIETHIHHEDGSVEIVSPPCSNSVL